MKYLGGDKVEFEVTQDPKGLHTINVKIISQRKGSSYE